MPKDEPERMRRKKRQINQEDYEDVVRLCGEKMRSQG